MSGTRLLEELSLTWLDLVAVGFLIAAWVGYVAFAASRRTVIPKDNPEQYAPQINRLARIASYAGSNFNNGLRAYYFGLAALAWFLHPWLMIAATLWIMLVLYQREFGSKTLKAMIEDDRSPTVSP